MSTENKNADQADILSQLEQARADLGTAKASIGTLQGQVTVLTSERDTARANLTTITQERDALKAENATLKDQTADFNKRLAAELAKHGIRNAEATDKPADVPGKKLNATEKVLAKKGVKSLAELEAARTK